MHKAVRKLRRASHKYVNSSPSETTRLQAMTTDRVQVRCLRAVHQQDRVVVLMDLLLVDPCDKFFHNATVPLCRTHAEHDLPFIRPFCYDVQLLHWILAFRKGRVPQVEVEPWAASILLAQLQARVDVRRCVRRSQDASMDGHVVRHFHANRLVLVTNGCPGISCTMAQYPSEKARGILESIPLGLWDIAL